MAGLFCTLKSYEISKLTQYDESLINFVTDSTPLKSIANLINI